MPSPRTVKAAVAPRETLFLALIVTLAVAQLIAFWMLCNYQVRHAQARAASAEVRTAAVPQGADPNGVLAATDDSAHFGSPAGRTTPVNFKLH